MNKVDLHPTICNLCGGRVIYATNDIVYGKRYGSGYCYYCTECKSYVGTHNSRPKEALGLLANDIMRKGKIACHEIFDSKWKGQLKEKKKRRDLYRWLSKQLDIPLEQCHFGYFDLDMLRKAYRILLAIKEKPIRYDNCGNITNASTKNTNGE